MKFILKGSRLLTTWILAAVLLSGPWAGQAAHAGDPDLTQGAPQPSQQGLTGDANLPLAMQIQAALQALLLSLRMP